MLGPAPRLAYSTAADGYAFAVRVWEAPQPLARVVVIHGIVSHGGWYLSSGRHLATHGYEVHALDRRGSGLNVAARGDVDRHETWLSDVEDYLARLPQTLPTVLLGISWGGKFAAAIARRPPPGLVGVGLICPGLFARQQASLGQRLLLRAAGAGGLSRLRIAIPLRDPVLFTDTPRWQRYVQNDPLTLWRITIRFAVADLQLNRVARAAAEQIRTPTLLMLAGRERIVDNLRTRAFFERIPLADKTCVEYPDAGHTLEFEPDPTRYLADLRSWIDHVTTR